jgi:hypothetical protein
VPGARRVRNKRECGAVRVGGGRGGAVRHGGMASRYLLLALLGALLDWENGIWVSHPFDFALWNS